MKKYIGLLLVLFLVSGCSFSFSLKDKKAEEKQAKKEETSVNTVFYEAAQKIIVNDLLDMVSVGRCGVENGLDFTSSNKLTLDNLTDDYKYSMAYYNLYKNAYLESISKEKLQKSYNDIFGTNISLPNKIAIYMIGGFEFNNTSGTYDVIASGYGCMSYSNYLLESYETKNNDLSFDVIYYIVDFKANQTEPIDREIKNKYENQDYAFDISSDRPTDTDLQKVKTNKDKFTQYRFNFKLNNDHYIFDSVEKIN